MRRILIMVLAFAIPTLVFAQSSLNARQVQVNNQRLDKVIGAQLSVTQFGAVDDDATDNTAAFTAAIAAASAQKRTLVIPAANTGAYRLSPSVAWGTVNLQFDEGARFKNLDGSAYSGFFANAVGTPQSFNPGTVAAGQRVEAPGSSTAVVGSISSGSGYARQFTTVYQGQATASAPPYTTNGVIRGVGLLGQAAPSSGSFGVLVGQINNYQHTNGPGVTVTGTLTNGSATITNVSSMAGIFDPAVVTSTTAGLPVNAFIADGGLGTTTLTLNAPYTGTTTTGATINVVSGFSEITPIALGSFDLDGGPNRKAMARYYDYDISTNVSSSAADQERFISGALKYVVKFVPGNVSNKILRGSQGDGVITRPGGEGFNATNRATTPTYPLSVGRLTWGYSGDPTTVTGGQSANATPGFLVGDQIGGVGQTVWDRETQRGYELVGQQIEDYENDGIVLKNPRAVSGRFTGRAITVAQGAGDIRSGDHFASNGASPIISSQSVTGHTISTGASDAHFTITAPTGSTGFGLTWAKPYTNSPDVVCSSPTNTQLFYTASPTGFVTSYGAAGGTVKFTCIAMGV